MSQSEPYAAAGEFAERVQHKVKAAVRRNRQKLFIIGGYAAVASVIYLYGKSKGQITIEFGIDKHGEPLLRKVIKN
jgi:hypothetical protein